MAKKLEGKLQAQGMRFALVVGRFNDFITSKLLEGALDALRRHGAEEDNISIAWVPGAFEIPLAAKRLVASGDYDAVVALGAVRYGVPLPTLNMSPPR